MHHFYACSVYISETKTYKNGKGNFGDPNSSEK